MIVELVRFLHCKYFFSHYIALFELFNIILASLINEYSYSIWMTGRNGNNCRKYFKKKTFKINCIFLLLTFCFFSRWGTANFYKKKEINLSGYTQKRT